MPIETREAPPSRRSGVSGHTRTGVVICCGMLLIGAAQPVLALPDAADPETPVAPAKYRPVIDGYQPFRPVEPKDWQGVNRDVAPRPKTEPEKQDGQR